MHAMLMMMLATGKTKRTHWYARACQTRTSTAEYRTAFALDSCREESLKHAGISESVESTVSYRTGAVSTRV